jgi:hypothetical protein
VNTGNDPPISITVVADQTKCNPLNGELLATITDGTTGYTFDWYDISLNPLGVSGANIKNLTAGNYLVRVSKAGCSKNSSPVTVKGPVVPDATATTLLNVTDCSNPNSGSVSADAVFNGIVQPPANYTFDWYYYNNATSTRGSILPAANGTGQIRTGLAVGYYQAFITDNATKCVSSQTPVTQITSQTVIPTAQITQVAPQTSCDPANPNGSLQGDATVSGIVQNPAGYKFEWFKGQNTLVANLQATVSGTNGQVVTKVVGGGIPYTVKVTNTANNCSATVDFTIAESLTNPVLTLAQLTPNTVCDATKATAPYNGSIQGTVTYGGSSVTLPDPNYTFSWYDGNTTTTAHTPPTSASNILGALKDGNYTAVVSRTDNFCKSTAITTTVAKTTVIPTLSVASTGSNNCDAALTPDGTATVSVTNTLPGDAFTYQWYKGNGVVPANALVAANNATAATAIKLGGPVAAPTQYTVYVLNTSTGCDNNTTQFVADNSIVPVLSFSSVVANSICSPSTSFNGSLTSSVTNIPAGYVIADYTFKYLNV